MLTFPRIESGYLVVFLKYLAKAAVGHEGVALLQERILVESVDSLAKLSVAVGHHEGAWVRLDVVPRLQNPRVTYIVLRKREGGGWDKKLMSCC